MKKLTIEELINKKAQMEQSKVRIAELYIKRLDGCFTINTPSTSVVNEAMKLDEGGDLYLVTKSIVEPNINSKELQEVYGCKNGKELVGKILLDGEIKQLAQKALELAGFTNDAVTVADKVKN